eukprot:16041298-Heterocapsa_arctica.AAC.1
MRLRGLRDPTFKPQSFVLRNTTKWYARHDRALAKLFSYVNSSLGLKLTGSMPVNGMDDARLVIWPDADLAGDKHSSKATG